MTAPLLFVRDGRTLPFIPVSLAALKRIRERCDKRVYATATYMALLELANEDRTDRVAVTQKLLAERVGAGRTTVQAAITDLEAAGLVLVQERSHGGQRLENEYVVIEPGDESDTLARHTGDPSPATRATPARHTGDGRPPGEQLSQEGLEEEEVEQGERAGREKKKAGEDLDEVPADFPAELLPHLRGVVRVLRHVAADQQSAKAVSAKAVARVIEPRPRKPLVKAAHDLAAWAADRRDLRDIVATYRNWLDNPRTPTLAALERVTDRGHLDHEAPSSGSTGGAGGGNASKASRRAASMEESRRLAEELRSQGL